MLLVASNFMFELSMVVLISLFSVFLRGYVSMGRHLSGWDSLGESLTLSLAVL